ncbi:hypothetical protein WDV85_00405 [Pseudokineococcus sp. 5B2Z-1]|uniref:hypothetical protein n=1 Tax=Pseudokineococcus sp. 5B2Z-1 TaxID=3132744 RepID=UPI0030A2E4E3
MGVVGARRVGHHLERSSGWWLPGLRFAAARELLPVAPPGTVGALVDALALQPLDTPVPPPERAALVASTGNSELAPLRSGDEWLGWRLTSLVRLVLDSPSAAAR